MERIGRVIFSLQELIIEILNRFNLRLTEMKVDNQHFVIPKFSIWDLNFWNQKFHTLEYERKIR